MDGLFEAVEQLTDGTTILLADGEYRLTRPLVLDRKQRVTIRSSGGDPARVTLRGRGWESHDDHDDILHIAHCDTVTVADLSFEDCHSYAIKVEAENAPRNVLIHNCRFRNIGIRAIKGSAGQDPDVRAINGSVRHCHFENTRVPPADWQFEGDYISAIDMMALENWTFRDNSFRNIRGHHGGGRAAIFVWVRSRQVTIERNLILNCDRGISLGNPGESTANQRGERLVYVADAIVRNNMITGGADCGIELWHTERVKVLHNTIWRPEQNWERGIRIGRGTREGVVINNLIHGQIQLEGGEATLRSNLTGRQLSLFADLTRGDLALLPSADAAVDRGELLADVTDDIRRAPRDPRPDLGAWEASRP